MVERELLVTNPSGLHTRPAKKIVDLAKTFASEITLEKGDKSGSAKTLIKVMKLGITMGTSVTVRCEGEDEEAALEGIAALIAGMTE